MELDIGNGFVPTPDNNPRMKEDILIAKALDLLTEL